MSNEKTFTDVRIFDINHLVVRGHISTWNRRLQMGFIESCKGDHACSIENFCRPTMVLLGNHWHFRLAQYYRHELESFVFPRLSLREELEVACVLSGDPRYVTAWTCHENFQALMEEFGRAARSARVYALYEITGEKLAITIKPAKLTDFVDRLRSLEKIKRFFQDKLFAVVEWSYQECENTWISPRLIGQADARTILPADYKNLDLKLAVKSISLCAMVDELPADFHLQDWQ